MAVHNYTESILQSTVVQPEMPLTTPLSRKHTTIWSNFYILYYKEKLLREKIFKTISYLSLIDFTD